MESLWWLAAFFVFDKDVVIVPRDPLQPIDPEWVEPEDTRRARLLLQSDFSVPIFHQLDGVARLNFFGLNDILEGAIPRLHPYLRHTVALNLEQLRKKIVARYCKAEQNPRQIDYFAAQPLYGDFAIILAEATESVNTDLLTMEMRSLASTIRDEKLKASGPGRAMTATGADQAAAGADQAAAGAEEADAGAEEAAAGTEEAVTGTEEAAAATEETLAEQEEAVPEGTMGQDLGGGDESSGEEGHEGRPRRKRARIF